MNSRRPSVVRTDTGDYPAVVLHGASAYGTMEADERASPIIHTTQHADLGNAGSSVYTAMYPTLDRSSSAASSSEPEYQYSQPDLSPNLRDQHLLAGYPDQSPQPNTPSADTD